MTAEFDWDIKHTHTLINVTDGWQNNQDLTDSSVSMRGGGKTLNILPAAERK